MGFGKSSSFEIVADETPSPEVEASDRQFLHAAYAEIQKLPLRMREALILVAIDGRSQKEAAVLLGITEKAVEGLVYRARNTLRKKLDVA